MACGFILTDAPLRFNPKRRHAASRTHNVLDAQAESVRSPFHLLSKGQPEDCRYQGDCPGFLGDVNRSDQGNFDADT